jgi:hypothetical protein
MDDLDASASPRISVPRSAWRWWKDIAAREGRAAATLQLLSALVEFARDSTPERRRQRYGDAEYDWEHRGAIDCLALFILLISRLNLFCFTK